MMDNISFGYLAFFSIHFIIFLLCQFEVLRICEKSMIQWIRVTNILETAFLVITHIFSFSTKICLNLNCNIEDVMQIVPDEG